MKDSVAKGHYWPSMCMMFWGQSVELARRRGQDGLGAGVALSQAGNQDRRFSQGPGCQQASDSAEQLGHRQEVSRPGFPFMFLTSCVIRASGLTSFGLSFCFVFNGKVRMRTRASGAVRSFQGRESAYEYLTRCLQTWHTRAQYTVVLPSCTPSPWLFEEESGSLPLRMLWHGMDGPCPDAGGALLRAVGWAVGLLPGLGSHGLLASVPSIGL